MLNPCGEIVLGEPRPVVPWVQIQMMNMLRVRSGKPPFTPGEIVRLELALTKCRNCGMAWNDDEGDLERCYLCGRKPGLKHQELGLREVVLRSYLDNDWFERFEWNCPGCGAPNDAGCNPMSGEIGRCDNLPLQYARCDFEVIFIRN